MAVDTHLVFTACGKICRGFLRSRQVAHVYEGHEHDIILLLPFSKHLITIDAKSFLKLWDIQSHDVYLELSFDQKFFEITALVHPATYLNKLLLGSKQGTLQLWNLKTSKLLYTFAGWGSEVMVLEQAPAVDVVAVGLVSGDIVIHNIKYDETVMKFTQDWGAVTALTFRTDGHPILASGSTPGHIVMWDLEKKRLACQIEGAHSSAVTGMRCLPSEPLMVTSSADNSLKVWIFDLPDGGARILRHREGHSAPPNKLRFHDNDGEQILSAGQDSVLRLFSTVHDRHNRSLGRASSNKKLTKKQGLKLDEHMMPPVTDFASETVRESDWDNVVACHRGLAVATTWSTQRGSMGKHKLLHERFAEQGQRAVALVVTMSACGNFCLVGYSSGHADLFNVQSGLHRGSYGNPKAHDDAVRGVAIDGLNQVTVTAGGESTLKFWRFRAKDCLQVLQLSAAVSQIHFHRESAMLAVALDDFSVTVIDVDIRRVVRNFSGHAGRITDMAFSRDARWLVTACMDCTIRTWDLPTATLVDCFRVDSACTSLGFSPTGTFLVTAHVDDLGIYLWSNCTLYAHVSLRPLPVDIVPELVDLPTTLEPRSGEELEELPDSVEEEEVEEYKSPEQIADELVTLSLLPSSRWKNLTNLDLIRRRNKPKEPPKVPKAAPFFLPTVANVQGFEFATTDGAETSKDKGAASQAGKLNRLKPLSQFGSALEKAHTDAAYGALVDALKEMGPSAIDMELRELAPDGGGSIALMQAFLDLLHATFETRRNYELAQAYLALFLKVHADLIVEEAALAEKLQDVADIQQDTWRHLQLMFNESIGLVSYLKNTTL
ncbi:PREDICTED: WD repeat-containing protein 36-like [Priapulus caudatus]|uniref:WD repeat-containing protein 36-like n=1 Tax=Priapulus caudatus TaxID=37621 RepID=A0ABM1E264_PRICU|nr:PREDICTED: WD repeat-containing protein 36-like [Priapulus caudatus]